MYSEWSRLVDGFGCRNSDFNVEDISWKVNSGRLLQVKRLPQSRDAVSTVDQRSENQNSGARVGL